MKRVVVIVAALGFSLVASADEIETRQEAMKSVGGAMKTLSGMANGSAAFDAALVEAKLKEIEAAASALPDLFPEGSINAESEAAPAIWERRAEFDALVEKFIAASTVSAVPADEFELADVMKSLGENCKACHQDFRIKTD